jgi:Flp pilus assembly protein CpaB
MTADFRDPSKRRRRLLLVIGVLIALVAGYLAFSLSNAGNRPAPSEAPKRTVVVAARDIPIRSTLTQDDVTTREVPDDPSLGLAYADPAPVIGRVTTVPLASGQVIYPNVLVTTVAGAPFSIFGPEESPSGDTPLWRAVSVLVPTERAVGGQILTGQRVDLFVTVKIVVTVITPDGAIADYDVPGDGDSTNPLADEGLRPGDSTKIVFEDLEVLQALPDQAMYILKVDLHQAEQITHIAEVAQGAFSLALRGDGDTRTADLSEYGETTDSIILRYNFRVPQVIDLNQLGAPIVIPPSPRPTPSGEPAPTESPTP